MALNLAQGGGRQNFLPCVIRDGVNRGKYGKDTVKYILNIILEFGKTFSTKSIQHNAIPSNNTDFKVSSICARARVPLAGTECQASTSAGTFHANLVQARDAGEEDRGSKRPLLFGWGSRGARVTSIEERRLSFTNA